MLLELASLSEVPAADRVVQASRPQLGAVVGDVDAARSVRVALELPAGGRHSRGSEINTYTNTHMYRHVPSYPASSPIQNTIVWVFFFPSSLITTYTTDQDFSKHANGALII